MYLFGSFWLFDKYLRLFDDYLRLLEFLITNNYQIMVMLFDDYSIVISMPIIPIIQIIKSKCEYLVLFWQIIFTSQQSLFDDYLWLFDYDYLMIICIICIIWYTETFHPYKKWAKQTTHPFSLLPGYAASKYLWSGLHDWQRLPLICLTPHCKASPVFLDVGGEYCTNARMRTRHYSLCIWNSRIALSACFAFDLFGGASSTSASAMHHTQAATRHVYCSRLNSTLQQ